MNALSTFTFKSTSLLSGVATIRVITIDGEPWFVAADVCRALSMDTNSGVKKYLGGLDVSEMQKCNLTSLGLNTPDQTGGNDRRRGNPLVVFISESGLYKLVMRSDKPKAKPFRDWVTQEVLPSIRKNGGYIAGQERLRSGEMSDLEFLARAQEVAGRVLAQVQEDNKRLLRPPIPPP